MCGCLQAPQLLGHKVIAEGIETADQLATLRSMGVHEGQGYLLSRPLRSDQVADLLAVTETVSAKVNLELTR